MRWLKLGILGAGLMCMAGIASAGRPVVLEEFTATWCPYCYAAGRALDRVEENYKRSAVIVMAYHINDDFSIGANVTRYNYYSTDFIPSVWFNGNVNHIGGAPVSSGESGINTRYQIYADSIAQEQTRTANSTPFTITLTGSVGPLNPQLTATVKTATGYPRSVQARFFITEDHIPYAASNGQTVLNGLVRASLGTKSATLTSAGGQAVLTASMTGTVTCNNKANLYPVVIIQDDTTHEIVGATGEFTVKNAASNWSLYE